MGKGTLHIHELDVTSEKSVAALKAKLKTTSIDLLINNAGVNARDGSQVGKIDFAAWESVLAANTLGPMRVSEAFLENVAASEMRKIAVVTSVLGSIATTRKDRGGGLYQYRSSKAALNMAMTALAQDVQTQNVTVILLHPGWVKTDMGGAGADIEPRESVSGMRKVIESTSLSESGAFFRYDGSSIPW